MMHHVMRMPCSAPVQGCTGRAVSITRPLVNSRRGVLLRRAIPEDEAAAGTTTTDAPTPTTSSKSEMEKDISKFSRQAAGTFAPRSSTAKGKNPAVKGSVLYKVFEYQAWLGMVVGGLLSFNLIFPTDEPAIPRLLGMWAIWMFTIPGLRAKECTATEKDALNILFLAIPLINVLLPFIWKSFPFIYSADVLVLFGTYWYKGVWSSVYGWPLNPSQEIAAKNAVADAALVAEMEEQRNAQ